MRIWQQVTEDKVARDTGEPGAGIVAFDAHAGVLDELSVFDAGGAGGFAGTTVEAFVYVIHEGLSDGLVVQFDLNHLVDSAARGIGFEIPEAVSGAGVEA
jgi:hypothetical protein